ncbi:MAG TPA: sigma-54 dependent transcriptional regulator [Luteibacter sp.]|uniref:sigma-54-dependent transcriptional regulator n=1 Tax=Luteibacter sp. TaxID=1886636 RepID=UPI002C8B7E8B|nr:sigma-54 dependent transcriptional regulator [Luteibacter sp.]HVI55711.1 sigma-54 dependent transcriptional regulator [Luteibacter sp.]
MALILLIDDDHDFRTTLAVTLGSMGHEVLVAHDGEEGLAMLQEAPIELAFVDYRMPRMDGIAFLRRRQEHARLQAVPVVMLTAFASGQNTIDAMSLGAFDHLTKPIGRAALAEIVTRALTSAHRPVAPVSVDDDTELAGNSQAMRQVQKRIGLAAGSDVPVLITGETGTGKELVARALHRASARARGPFVAVNCAAIPADLLESELFGHRRGAFSGATTERQGYFREADGGTLLLDEIGDMPLAMQAKLLRVLQEAAVTPLGSSQPVPVDVRVLAATHRRIDGLIADGRFRSDLFYRLNVLPIELGALRDRREDIPLLAERFLRDGDLPAKQLTETAVASLQAYDWPGNVRELRNMMDRCRVLVAGRVIDAADLASMFASPAPAVVDDDAVTDLPEAVARLERSMIVDALAKSGGNRAETARRLGIRRQLLYRKLVDYGLE